MTVISAHPAGSDSTCVDSELECLKWKKLSDRFLPVDSEDSIWRYSRASRKSDPDQGWKLHVSATIRSANKVFEAVAPYLRVRGVLFKAPRSLQELEKLNSGIYYGYSQVGKFITVYPRSAKQATSLARRLHLLSGKEPAPAVPFDFRFRSDSCIYYRYGSFQLIEIENPNGTRTPAMRDLQGNLIPDLRLAEKPHPAWVVNPFVNAEIEAKRLTEPGPLLTTFRAFQSLSQRGKGGVYKALDFSVQPPRLCLLKEGRGGGEVGWDGRDGHWLIENEEQVLTSLRATGMAVPAVYSSFALDGNFYLVTEFIEGETLQDFLSRQKRRLPLSRAMGFALQLAELLSQMHRAGWIWRDCKPANVIIARDGRLRPVDFEGACPIDGPDETVWSTPVFSPRAVLDRTDATHGQGADLYALGAVIYFLLSGRLPESANLVPVERVRKSVPRPVLDLVAELLAGDPQFFLKTDEVLRRLRDAV